MKEDLKQIRNRFVDGMGEISHFWGLSVIMGQMYGILYLSTEPLTADGIAEELVISKGNVSMTLKNLDRWGMVRKSRQKGDRKEYYEAEPNFVKIFLNIMSERRNRDFNRSLRTVGDCLASLASADKSKETAFMRERLSNMHRFFKTLDASVATLLKLVGAGKAKETI